MNKKIVDHRQDAYNYCNRVWYKYHVRCGTIEELMNKQKGCCAICKESLIYPFSEKNYCIDHDHESDMVRGLLCSNCNTAFGLLFENENTILNMLQYHYKCKIEAELIFLQNKERWKKSNINNEIIEFKKTLNILCKDLGINIKE
jgi:hypothetical protein